ncbi:MAG TPA: HEAT repeat domain-containing protein [Gemmatimonadales bacterium]|jgi:HEAT repeat protein|nr:HEAT repeat domain-containing protein [Gemmatimonadales bacterium]
MRTTTFLFALAATIPMFMTAGPSTTDQQGPAVVQADDMLPPPAWLQGDPADSLYRAARSALQRNDFVRAVSLFHQVRDRYPRSEYAPVAYYWEAFSLYRSGGDDKLKQGRDVLRLQRERFPDSYSGNSQALETRICGVLADHGDADCARIISERATETATSTTTSSGTNATTSTSTTTRSSARCEDEDDDMRVAALNALLQMDADRAVPILRRVLARRDACSEVLRRKAIFLVSQKQTSETEDILLGAARTDPDEEVRQQAVFWLSQVGTERAVSALDSILRTSNDRQMQEKAIFALSQVNKGRASAALRAYAERNDAPTELREQAIFWIGQSNNADNARYLQTLYGTLREKELKEKVIFSLSQQNSADNARFIMNIALNESEDIDMRKQALFWAGQQGGSITDLVALYAKMTNPEMKEQLIFVYSQRNEKPAVDKLVDIARSDPDREMRKKALFWLSQSNDPRVAEILQQIIDQ